MDSGGVVGAGVAAVAEANQAQTHNSSIMTTSLPTDDLDQLGNRLERFVHGGGSSPGTSSDQRTSPNGCSKTASGFGAPRKNSAGSQIPKPEVTPKPAFLASMSQSFRSPLKSSSKASSSSTVTSPSPTSSEKEKNSTASMLKSTLRRMTRLSVSSSQTQKVQNGDSGKAGNNSSLSRRRVESPKRSSPPSGVHRSRSFREATGQDANSLVRNNSNMNGSVYPQRNSVLSSSLRKPRNKDRDADTSTGPRSGNFQRSGTGGALDRRSGVNRSHSVAGNRRYRDRDLNVKKSRCVQTQLTRDIFHDEEVGETEQPPTSIDFSLHMPMVLGLTDDDQVETHVTEPTEPVDVRKNRQLTLDNMKLHREVERLKAQVGENDHLKKELRSVKTKLEEEQRSRLRIEQQLDRHNEKVKMIVQSMDCVEREFETRDGNIVALEKRLEEANFVNSELQRDLDASTDLVHGLHQDLDKALSSQKTLLQQYQEAEAESKELQEFLQAEKMTLSETLKDCESEISSLKKRLLEKDSELAEAEERCSHLVRLGEQRHQEILTLEAQLVGVQERAKDMIVAQGAEISRANIYVSDLYVELEKILNSTSKGDGKPLATAAEDINGVKVAQADSDNGLIDPKPPRSNSQFLVSVPNGNSNGVGVNNSINELSRSTISDQNLNPSGTSAGGIMTTSLPVSESLQNLSLAITQRQQSENGTDSIASSNSSLPSLVDKISDVQSLVERLKLKQNSSRLVNGGSDVNEVSSSSCSKLIVSNGINGKNSEFSEELKSKDREIHDLKSKYLKYRQILASNYEQAEGEIRRLDEMYHDTVERVLSVFGSLPELVSTTPALSQLKKTLEVDATKGIQQEISAALNTTDDRHNANHSL